MNEQGPSEPGGEEGAASSTSSTSRTFLPQLVPPATGYRASEGPTPSTTSAGNEALPSHSPRVVKFSMDEVHLYAQWFLLDVSAVRDVVLQCKGNRELILATLAMSAPRNKHDTSRSSGGGGALPALAEKPAAPPSRNDPPTSGSRQRTLSERQQHSPPPPLTSTDRGSAQVLLSQSASSEHIASPRFLHNPAPVLPTQLRIPHVPPVARAPSRGSLHSSGGGARGSADRADGRPSAESSTFRRATWHRERVMSIGALLAGVNDDASGGGGLRALAAALQRDEESSRLWLEDEARTGAVRIWRRSLVWQMNQEHGAQCALIAEETLARGTVVQRQEGTWYRLHVALVVGTEEMLRYRFLVDYEVASWEAVTRAELQARAETGYRVLVGEESWAWRSVFARALELTVAVVRLDRSQVMERENIEYEWVQFALQTRGVGRQLRAIHDSAVTEQALVWTVQMVLRGHLELQEMHRRCTMMVLHEAVVGDVVTLLLEPAGRANIWQMASDGYAHILALARFHCDVVVEHATRERCHRHTIAEAEAASRVELDAVVAYHALKARSASKAARRVALRIPAVLIAASQSLLLEWETSCREEIFETWRRSAAQIEELHRLFRVGVACL